MSNELSMRSKLNLCTANLRETMAARPERIEEKLKIFNSHIDYSYDPWLLRSW